VALLLLLLLLPLLLSSKERSSKEQADIRTGALPIRLFALCTSMLDN
jgi:hypothetical protein